MLALRLREVARVSQAQLTQLRVFLFQRSNDIHDCIVIAIVSVVQLFPNKFVLCFGIIACSHIFLPSNANRNQHRCGLSICSRNLAANAPDVLNDVFRRRFRIHKHAHVRLLCIHTLANGSARRHDVDVIIRACFKRTKDGVLIFRIGSYSRKCYIGNSKLPHLVGELLRAHRTECVHELRLVHKPQHRSLRFAVFGRIRVKRQHPRVPCCEDGPCDAFIHIPKCVLGVKIHAQLKQRENGIAQPLQICVFRSQRTAVAVAPHFIALSVKHGYAVCIDRCGGEEHLLFVFVTIFIAVDEFGVFGTGCPVRLVKARQSDHCFTQAVKQHLQALVGHAHYLHALGAFGLGFNELPDIRRFRRALEIVQLFAGHVENGARLDVL